MSTNESSNSPASGKNLQCKVYMLDDTTEIFEIPVKAKGILLFSAVVQKLHLLESDYFGLQYNDEDFIPCWLDYEKPLLKQVSRNRLFFKFLLKFYTPDPGLLEEEYTRYLLALQIKRDLVSGDLFCQEHTAVLLASYIVQAELGNYCDEYASQMYISQLHLLPNQTPEIEHQIMEHHKEHIGQTPAEADFNLLDTARKTELYGIQLHAAQDHDGASLHLAVSHSGILVFQNYTKINSFSWAKIRKLCFKRKKFLVKLHSEGMEGYKDVVEFYFPSRNWSKNFWKKCIEHHTFFRCHSIRKAPRNKAKVISHGSSFRYSGRTQKELVDFAREKSIKPVPFERTTSLRTMSALQSRAGSPRTGTLTSRDMGFQQNNPMLYGTQSYDRRQRPVTAGSVSGNFMPQQMPFHMDNRSEQISLNPAIPESALKSYQLPTNNSNMYLQHSQLRTLQRQQQQQQMGFSYLPQNNFQQMYPQNMGSLRSNDASNWRAAHGLPPKANPGFENNKSPSLQSSSSHLDPSQFMIGHYSVRSSDPLLVDSPEGNMAMMTGMNRGSVLTPGPSDPMSCRLSRTEEVDDIPDTIHHQPPTLPYMSPQSLHHSVSDGGILKARVETSVDDLTENQVSVDQFISSPRKLPLSHADSYFNNEDSSNNAPNNFNGSNNYNSNSSYNNSYNRSSPQSTAEHQSPFIDPHNYNGGYNFSTPNNNPALFNLSAASHMPDKSHIVADSDDDAKRKASIDTLFYLSKEVLMTERTYKKDLKVITNWLKEFVEEAGFSEDLLVTNIVETFTPLYKFHTDFLSCLEDRLMAWEGKSGAQLSEDHKRIGDVLLSLPSIFPLYTEVLKQHNGLVLDLEDAMKQNEHFEKTINDFESEKVCFLPLNCFLLKPAQRLLYYKHILEKMVSTMPADSHPDMPACCECLEELMKCIEPLEMNLLSIVNLHKLLELQRGLLGIEGLLQSERMFLREGCLQKLSRKGSQPRMFFLFSDKLVYTCRMTTPSLQFKIHGQIPLDGMSVSSDDPRAEAVQNGFVIYLKDNRCLVVAASSQDEKIRWINDLEEAIANYSPSEVNGDDNPYPSLKSTSSSELGMNDQDDINNNPNKQSMLQHKANNTVHVCWHRSTSVNIHDHSLALKNQLSGYLLRKFKNSNGWQKLWVSFTNFCLFFYKNYQDEFPLASLPLLNYTIGVPTEADSINKDYVFKLQFKNHVYFFRAESHVTFSRWMEVIGQVTIKLRGSHDRMLQ